MRPDDPRHGTAAGEQAHWRDGEVACAPCALARYRTRKQHRLEVAAGVRMVYSRAELDQVLEPWLAMGMTQTGCAIAAGLTHGARFVSRGGPVRRGTYHRIAALTDTDFDDNSTVWADLTRTRVRSLMAAGHQLLDMPLRPTGPWRTRDFIRVSAARAMRDYYQEHQEVPGPSAHTRSRALGVGWLPPAAWDDPGTVAWPLGATMPVPQSEQTVDEVAVQRVLSGDWRIPTSKAEKVEVVRRWRAQGLPLKQLQNRTGWKTERYYDPREVAAS